MVVTDLDGTYLRNDKTISEYTKDVIDRIRAKGIKFVIATARPVRAVRDWLPYVQYDAGAFHNGAVVMEREHRIGGKGIEQATMLIAKILQKQPQAHIAAEVNDWLYANFDAETIWPGIEYTETTDFAEITGMTADKVIIEAHSLEEMEQYQEYLSEELYLRLSENVIAMIMNKEATKSSSIRLLAERYGFSMEQVVAFGDDYNDMDMLQVCGRGVAVANALEAVKAVADEVCDSNNEDGPAKWLERECL
ncbi:MAG: HAD family hydrolase [Lachnospiraceae bacterium]|nr:HAD family hydrolase [Lachnospiraceae bacterium]